ncbi:MAG TPA: NAD-dependent epimerase/dehydratase family protein [Mycobacteriales bacterium]|nr:NAD-dependent epimerase/dehydratase family protein [Mycobacteriales bacterium]HVW80685.1 NAD-dependent epimerase/dehydratase family protein [Mycobacteriales bacterium]
MGTGDGRVRPRRSATVIGVTGSATPLGAAFAAALRADPAMPTVVDIDGTSPAHLAGIDVVVHLAIDRSVATPATQRHALNVHGTERLLDAVVASGVRRVVLLTSAMVYGASRAHRVPLDEDTAILAGSPAGLLGEWLAMERAALRHLAHGADLEVVSVRPASLVGLLADAPLPGLFESARLLAIRDGHCHWQFCHTDDLLSALQLAAAGAVSGAVTVGCEGWMAQRQVEAISGMRSVVLPAALAFATADRLHRVGALGSPSSDLQYLIDPWVVGSQRLRATGWTPAWTNQAALAAHLESLGDRVGRSRVAVDRRNATRAAAGAGATLAIVGSLALARARSRRR